MANRNMKDRYAPIRWTLYHVVHKAKGLLNIIWNEKKGSKKWYIAQFKRELEQLKKHIIFLEETIDFYEKSDEHGNRKKKD